MDKKSKALGLSAHKDQRKKLQIIMHADIDDNSERKPNLVDKREEEFLVGIYVKWKDKS